MMSDWYTHNFSVKGKSGAARRSAFLKHLALLIVLDVLLVVVMDVLLGQSFLVALIFALAISVIDLFGLLAEVV